MLIADNALMTSFERYGRSGEQENTLERGYKQDTQTCAGNHGGHSGPALEDGLTAAALTDRSRPRELRNCLNGRPEWTRTIDLFRVKEAL